MESISRAKRLGTIFFSMLYISAFTFGGGFVIVTLMKRRFVDELKWLDEAETLDIIALSQSAPGAIAVNASILLGWRLAGFPGMLAAVLGTIIPPVVIISLVYALYDAFRQNRYIAIFLRGMQSGVAAVLASVVWSLLRGVIKEKDVLGYAIMIAAFLLTWALSVNAAYIILGAGLVGAIKAIWLFKRGKRA